MEKVFQEILLLESKEVDVHSDTRVVGYESGYEAYCTILDPHKRAPHPPSYVINTSNPPTFGIESYPDVFHAMSHGWFLMVPPIINHDTQTCIWWMTRTIKIERD